MVNLLGWLRNTEIKGPVEKDLIKFPRKKINHGGHTKKLEHGVFIFALYICV